MKITIVQQQGKSMVKANFEKKNNCKVKTIVNSIANKMFASYSVYLELSKDMKESAKLKKLRVFKPNKQIDVLINGESIKDAFNTTFEGAFSKIIFDPRKVGEFKGQLHLLLLQVEEFLKAK